MVEYGKYTNSLYELQVMQWHFFHRGSNSGAVLKTAPELDLDFGAG